MTFLELSELPKSQKGNSLSNSSLSQVGTFLQPHWYLEVVSNYFYVKLHRKRTMSLTIQRELTVTYGLTSKSIC